jgi:hypothetical protein
VDPREGLDHLEKGEFLTLPGVELLPLSRPVRSQSLYRLSYPGSYPSSGSPLNVNRLFGRKKESNQQQSRAPSWFFLGQLFNPELGGDTQCSCETSVDV